MWHWINSALCNTSVRQSATAHAMHINFLGRLVCPCHNFYTPPSCLYGHHMIRQSWRKPRPQVIILGGYKKRLSENKVLRLDYRSYSVSLVLRMRTSLVEIQRQDFSVVSCSSKSFNIHSTLLKRKGYNNITYPYYLLAVRTDISFLSAV